MRPDDLPTDPDAFLGYTLVRLAHILERRIERRLRDEIGLSVRQFGALAHLNRDAGIGSGQLARLLLITPQSAGPLVDTLETKGLVVRDREARPGMRKAVILTERGQAALARGYAVAAQANNEDFATLPPDRRNALNRELHGILASLI